MAKTKRKEENKDIEAEYKEAEKMVVDKIKNDLLNGKEVTLRTLGIFKIKIHQARKGRNPKTNEEMQISKRKAIKFNVCKKLKKQLNKK